MLLKDRRRLDQLLRDDVEQRRLIPRLLAVAVGGFAIYGFVATVVLNGLATTYHTWWELVPQATWGDRTIGNLLLAYTIGLIAANGICLPSFYFYSLLAGVRMSMLFGRSAGAERDGGRSSRAGGNTADLHGACAECFGVHRAESLVESWVILGLLLPFIAGTWGAACLYEGFAGFADTIPAACRGNRACFLRRLILAWSGCYTCVTPLVTYTLWNFFSGSLGG